MDELREIEFCGRSVEVIRSFPVVARREIGYQLDRVQRGLDPIDWKPMPAIGKGVREIRVQSEGQYRVIYLVKFRNRVHVLHAFRKKERKTRKQDLEAARSALKDLLGRYGK